MAKKIRDETIIDALLISATVRSAAAKLEINEQTIYRRKRDPEFMQKYNEARRERTEAARNVLQERAHAAADTLATIMQDADVEGGGEFRTAEDAFMYLRKYGAVTPDGKRIVLYPHPVEGVDALSLSLYEMLDEAIERGKLELPELESDEIGGKALE